jgi:hypothetical protein
VPVQSGRLAVVVAARRGCLYFSLPIESDEAREGRVVAETEVERSRFRGLWPLDFLAGVGRVDSLSGTCRSPLAGASG